MQVTKKVKIIEPYALFDYNFLKNNKHKINGRKPEERDKLQRQ